MPRKGRGASYGLFIASDRENGMAWNSEILEYAIDEHGKAVSGISDKVESRRSRIAESFKRLFGRLESLEPVPLTQTR